MDRRDFLRTSGSAAAAAGAITPLAAAHAQGGQRTFGETAHIASGVRELGLAMSAPDNGRGAGESARRLARRIECLTGERYRIRILSGPAAQDADMMHGSANDHLDADAAFAFFAGLPGSHGLPPVDLDAWVAIGGGQMVWDDLAAELGWKPFLAGHSGANPVIWSRQPLIAANGLQGLKFAADGLARDVARGLGAQPFAVTAFEAAQALSEGRIDALEGPGAMYSLAAGLSELAPFALTAGINRQGTAQSLSVKIGVWDSMSFSEQTAVASAAAEEFRLCCAEARAHEQLSWRVMRERHNVLVGGPVEELSDAINRVSDAVVAHMAGASRQAQRINASFMAFKVMLPMAPAVA
ncbi:MAG: twin-arginine translocation signal domain-containing protein [Hyphomicrobium sp.]